MDDGVVVAVLGALLGVALLAAAALGYVVWKVSWENPGGCPVATAHFAVLPAEGGPPAAAAAPRSEAEFSKSCSYR
jgi:hypothetical protein